MTSSRLFRIGGLALLLGAFLFTVHIVGRSVITAGPDPATFAKNGLWVPVNALGAAGAVLVLLGLPALYLEMAGSTGVLGFLGVVLLAVGWIFLGVFLSLYGLLVAPWLADRAPSLVVRGAPLPAGVVVAFVGALLAQILGALLLAVPFLRRRVQPRWVGFALPASALLTIAGDLVAPDGPAASVAVNLLSNVGPVLLVAALGALGFQTWSEHAPAAGRSSKP